MKKIILIPLLMLLIGSSYAQLGVAPLPKLQPVTGPSLEETQEWVKKRLEAIGVVARRKETVLFDGCKFYIFAAKFNNENDVGRIVQHGNLEDIDFDGDPNSIPTTVGGRKLFFNSFNFGVYHLQGESARRFWRFDPEILQELKRDADVQRAVYTTEHDSIFFVVAGDDDTPRFTKAFMHMARLCAAEKAKPKQKFVKPTNEPF